MRHAGMRLFRLSWPWPIRRQLKNSQYPVFQARNKAVRCCGAVLRGVPGAGAWAVMQQGVFAACEHGHSGALVGLVGFCMGYVAR